jgi:acyl-CoA thioester hydrolase
VGVRVTAVGRTSVTMEYAVWPEGSPDAPSAKATSVVVLVDYATMSKVPVPDEVRAKLAALSGEG